MHTSWYRVSPHARFITSVGTRFELEIVGLDRVRAKNAIDMPTMSMTKMVTRVTRIKRGRWVLDEKYLL